MIKVYQSGRGKLASLQVLEHEITFNVEGFADGTHLTKEEVDRLRRFHFPIEIVPDEEPVPDAKDVNPADGADDPDDDGGDEPENAADAPEGEPSPTAPTGSPKPRRQPPNRKKPTATK